MPHGARLREKKRRISHFILLDGRRFFRGAKLGMGAACAFS